MLKLTLIAFLSILSITSFCNDDEVIAELEKKQANSSVDPMYTGSTGVKFPGHPRRMADFEIGIEEMEQFAATPKFKFAGVEAKVGPTLTFNRKYSLTVYLLGGGNDSLIQDVGDYGSVLNITDDRQIITWCTVNTSASHSIAAGGSLSFYGVGASVEANTWQALNVSQTSAVKYVDKYSYGMTHTTLTHTTLEDIIDDCKKNFFHAAKASLDHDLKKLTEQLVYEHEQTQCIDDQDCHGFYNRQSKSAKRNSLARCVNTEVGDGSIVPLCRLKGTEGKSCPIFNNKGRQLNSKRSIPCDEEYFKCETTVEGGWSFNFAELSYTFWQASCKPKKTYKTVGGF